MKLDELIQLGKIHKAHGIKGWLKITFSHPLLLSQGQWPEVLFAGNDSKKAIPYPVEELTQTNADQYLLKLEELTDKSAADMLVGQAIWLPETEAVECFDLDAGNLDYLTGFTLHNQTGEAIATVDALVELPGQLLLEITYEGRELLIPLAEDLILDINRKKKTIQMHITEGLLDL